MKNILIIGGDSMIGNGLAMRSSSLGMNSVTTTRRQPTAGKISLNLAEWKRFSVPDNLDAAILCAGASGFALCETDGEAERVNTVYLPALVDKLLLAGVFTVVLSSSAIFADGARRPRENTAPCPATAYGRQKALAEQKALLSAGASGAKERLCIVRLTKVVDATKDPVAAWRRNWAAEKPARAFTDVRTSPITLDYVAAATHSIISGRKAGIWHLSGETGISYAELCLRLARAIGVNPDMVEATTAMAAGVPAPFRPVDGALDMTLTTRETGAGPQPLESVMADLRKQIMMGES